MKIYFLCKIRIVSAVYYVAVLIQVGRFKVALVSVQKYYDSRLIEIFGVSIVEMSSTRPKYSQGFDQFERLNSARMQ